MSKNTYAYLEAAENLTFSYYGDRARYAALIGSFAPPNPTTLVDLVSNFDAAVISFVDTNNASIDGATDHDWLRKLRTLYAGIFGAETTAPDGRLLVAAIMHYGAGTIPNDPVFPATSNPGSCQNFLGANYKVAGNADYVPFLLIKDTNAALFSAFDSSMDSDGNANTTPCCTLVISKNRLFA